MPSASELEHIASSSMTEEAVVKKKRKGPKGPNPLSVKKKQKDSSSIITKPKSLSEPAIQAQKTGEKRKRGDDSGLEMPQGSTALTIGGHRRKRRRKTANAHVDIQPVADNRVPPVL
jgi:U3 small nucleolar RNA-associated protein 23